MSDDWRAVSYACKLSARTAVACMSTIWRTAIVSAVMSCGATRGGKSMRMPEPLSEGSSPSDVVVYPVLLLFHAPSGCCVFDRSVVVEDHVLFFGYVHKDHCMFACRSLF